MVLAFEGKSWARWFTVGLILKNGPIPYQFFIKGELLDPNKMYKVAIPDMFAFGQFFPSIYRAKNKEFFLPEFLRHLLEWKLSEPEKQSVK